MEPREWVWEPGRRGPWVRRVLSVVMACALVAGGSLAAARVFAGKPVARKKRPVPTVSASATPPGPGRAIGVITSTSNDDKGGTTTISTIDASENVQPCLAREARITLLDLSRRVLIFSYVDGVKDGVYSIAIDDCPRAKPRLLALYGRVFNATENPPGVQLPASSDEAYCGSFSADGTKIVLGVRTGDEAAGSWIGTSSGTGWHHVSEWIACRWLNATTIVASNPYNAINTLIDPIAIDISSGRTEFVADPDSLNGNVSYDGSLVFYQRSEQNYPATQGLIIDRGGGSAQAVSLERPPLPFDPSQLPWFTIWNEDHSRFLLTESADTGNSIAIYARGARSAVREPVTVGLGSAGWFAPDVVWFTALGRLRFIDLETENRTEALTTDEIGQVMIADQRQGDLGGATVALGATPIDSIRAVGVAFRRPPSWRVSACITLCDVDGYAFHWVVSSRYYPETTPLQFATTTDPVATVLSTINRSEKQVCSSGCTYYADRSSVKLGGVTFTRLVPHALNGAPVYYVGSFGHGTIVLRTTMEDPSEQLVLGSLRAL